MLCNATPYHLTMPNPDQHLIRRVMTGDLPAPQPMATNALLEALKTELIRAQASPGQVELRFTPGELFVQGRGVVQGGAVAAMLDFAMGFAALTQLDGDHTATTVNLNVAFLRPVQAGPLVAVGEVERAGRTLVFTRARLEDGQGRVVATATSTLPVIATG